MTHHFVSDRIYVQNFFCVAAWRRRWDALVGNAHVGVFKIIKEIQYNFERSTATFKKKKKD